MWQGSAAVKRITLTLVLFLLLGAIINVAVAWTAALFVELKPERDWHLCADQDWWYYRMQRLSKDRVLIWPPSPDDYWAATKQRVPSWSVASHGPPSSVGFNPRDSAGR